MSREIICVLNIIFFRHFCVITFLTISTFPFFARTVTRTPCVETNPMLKCLQIRLMPRSVRPAPRPDLSLDAPDARTKYSYRLL